MATQNLQSLVLVHLMRAKRKDQRTVEATATAIGASQGAVRSNLKHIANGFGWATEEQPSSVGNRGRVPFIYTLTSEGREVAKSRAKSLR